jgi:Sec-independent protein translocase protein TatA
MIGTTEIIIILCVAVFFFGIAPIKKWITFFKETKKDVENTLKDETKD